MKKVIILEGHDGSGKSTIKKELDKKSNYKYIIIDRFLGSSFVYNHSTAQEVASIESELLNNIKNADFYLVYLFCSDAEQLEQRLIEKCDIDKLNNIKKDMKKFEEYLDITYFSTLEIDTSTKDICACVEEITKFVEAK